MPWPIPKASAIAAKIAGSIEAGLLRFRPELDPRAVSRAVRSEKGVFSQIGRALSLELREAHDHIAWWGRQYFVDTAEDEFVLRHANIWNVPQRGATKAIGRVVIVGVAGTPLPAGLLLAASNSVQYVTTAPATIDAGGSIEVGATAVLGGTIGNLEAGVLLATVTAQPAVSKITVSAAFVGGAEEETPEELQVATLQRIRQPPHGGAAFDYSTWVRDQFPVKAVGVVPGWIGRGSVGVVVVMKNDDGSPRAPSADEVAAILSYLGAPGSQTGVRPVTANVVVVPGVLRTLTISVRLRPDTLSTRAAVADAWRRFVATIGDDDDDQNASPIGATIEPSRISEAISAASGEYAHDLLSPLARFTLDRTEYPIAGDPLFEAS
ncbi:baseplate J/gp47 family protein [Rhizobium sp. P38BS-XIX]|uniref:baseplate J/gp47 family protein n=1 Tax=Rhizobium sp. P38BS-XIX TaxID=2726740 RepID=UPI001457567B|nr:baseplate J/gp47 family protein [Rhizobium sp. P38BS-XIX]NLS00173.1 baseplate J/gp47 family protein [Rhizobium sp. P38BS-XIX]